MKEMIEVERNRSLADIQRELGENEKIVENLKREVQQLHEAAEIAEDERRIEKRRHEEHIEEIEATHRQVLRTQQQNFAKERERMDKEYREEIMKLEESAELTKSHIRKDHETQMNHQREHDEEIRGMLNLEIDRLKDECTRCREQLIEVTAQASSERDRLLQRFDEEKRILEADFQKSQAENVHALARIRSEVAERSKNMIQEEKLRRESFAKTAEKERADLIAQNILEFEELEEKQRKDLRRLEAQLEVRHGDEIAKLRKVHEQEVKRLIADNDRLHRSLLAKNKIDGASPVLVQQFRSALDDSNAVLRRAESRNYTPYTEAFVSRVKPGEQESSFPSGGNCFMKRGKNEQKTNATTVVVSPPPSPPKSPLGYYTGLSSDVKKQPKPENEADDIEISEGNFSPTTPFASLKNKDLEFSGRDFSTDGQDRNDNQHPSELKPLKQKIDWGSLQHSLDLQVFYVDFS